MSPSNNLESAHDCDAIQELIPEYAFGLTSPEETRRVESHLASCPDAVAELADFRHIQEEMRAGVPQSEPPPQLAERLRAATASQTAALDSPRRLPFHPAWLAAAAAVLALVITNVYWFARVEDVSRQTAELRALIGGGQTDNAFVLTSTRDLRWVRLPSEENAETNAFLMWNGASDTGLLYVHAFPRLAAGKTYQLWLTRGEERVSAGTFEVDEQGNAALIFHIPDPIDEFTWARVTDEPGHGSNEPTGTVVVHGELPTG